VSNSFTELRERLKQTNDWQVLLLEVTERIAAGGSLGALLPDIINAILRASGADGIRVVINQSPSAMTYATGTAAGKMLKYDTQIMKLVTERGALHIENLAESKDSELTALHESAKAIIALPLIALKTVQGVLWVAYEKAQKFTDEQLSMLLILAGQTAVAITNAYAYDTVRRGRAQLAAILNSSADPILAVDEKEAIVLINPAAERAFGVGAEALGKPVRDVINAQPVVDLLTGTSETAVNSTELEWQSDAGQTYSPRVSNMDNEQGEIAGRVLILRDITRYKNLRDNQSEFVSTVSHDLRSPLTYMHGYATMMPMVGELNEKQKGFADKIIAGIAQMTDLVDKILDASRLDPEGNYELNREPCDVNKMINDIANMHRTPAEKKLLTLNVDMDQSLPILNLDDVMLRRALNNLVDNAIKYTPENGSITLSANVKDNNLVFAVRDTGLGISEENKKILFERFKRVRRREHQTVKGNGLGLFIVRSVAQKHGGDAWVESKEGEGSTFAIKIPLEGPNLMGAESKRADEPIAK
jgi:PAS domain S-box-containing protein